MERKSILKEIIVSFHNSDLPSFYKRDLIVPLHTNKIISLIGPRRSGKTFFFFQTIAELTKNTEKENIVYINFEDERIELKKENLQLIIESYLELYPDKNLKNVWFFFDEIQNIEGWDKFVRRIYDNYSKKIFITGSNSKLLSREIATSLRGRTISYEIYPLSFREFLKFKNFKLQKNDFYDTRKRAKIKKYFTEYFLYGGFPEVVFIKDDKLKIRILQEYFNVMIYRDIVERYNIKNTPVLKYFLKRIIENIGKPLSVHKIYNELKSQGYKIGKTFLYEFIEMFKNAYIIFPTKKYSFSVLKTEFSPQKTYVIDNGLVNAVTFSYKNDYGKLLENLLAKEIKNSGFELFSHKNKYECDFIIRKKDEIIPVQVSYKFSHEGTRSREVKIFKELIKKLSIKKAFIVTYEEKDELLIGNVKINIIPAFDFLLNIKELIKI